MPDTTTTPGTTPRTVQEDTPVNTPTTAPAAPQARTWVYWIAYSFNGGGGACEGGFPAPITHGVQLIETGKHIARSGGVPQVAITAFTLLRVEDADGQVIG